MNCKLFCLPHAGGSATVYMRWKRYLRDGIELHPLEPAGRGKRLAEPHYGSLDDMIDDLCGCLEQQLDGSDFALFGHSMGALVAYELAHAIKRRSGREPIHLFVSGTYPPHAKKINTLHSLSDDRLREEITRLGGTEGELLEREDLLRLFLPVLRRDLELVETHRFEEKPDRIHCNLSVLSGKEDRATACYDLSEWSSYGSRACRFYEFEGGHFFINEHVVQVVSLINEALCSPLFQISAKKEP
ncbi:alpha/beta fold hydrolase [Paenibacillus dendritiformis]|uniref:thioesterase II family protein n=1 Tax=Paenibacillus dendritiformis TaxID=130049 RepID=UPI00248ABA67|nr:alpha/beta fold hydrolase [Paenibacillus dendritiformis]WGU96906.1 alpha/beta fold hydrolase [Paenibacillus dendritiformis]